MLFRRIAYPLLAAAFVADGLDALRNPKSKAEAAKPLLDQAQRRWPTLPSVDPVVAMQAEGAIKIGAGLMMAFGPAPRLAAAVLAVDLIPSTAAEYPFWSKRYPDARKTDQEQLIKNAGLLGGLLLAILDTGGNPSLAWRLRHAKKHAEQDAERVSRRLRHAKKHAEQDAERVSRRLRRAKKRAKKHAEQDAERVSRQIRHAKKDAEQASRQVIKRAQAQLS